MAEVTLDNISKVYSGGVRAVDSVSLTIRDQEFVVLVGPSGCGKSTTLRMIAGLEDISAGTITIGGRIVNAVAPRDRDIAMVFQNYALYPHMTVYRNMAFSLLLRRRLGAFDNLLFRLLWHTRWRAARAESEAIRARVLAAARKLDIENLLNRRPRALSGGQRQRVALGRAMVREPKAFLFDEPLSNLDARMRLEMRAELKRLHRQLRTTTIYVTHDQEEAMTLGDRVVVMHEGRVQQCDTPLAVYERPLNRFVAGFVGTPPMNFIDGRIAGENSAPIFESPALRLALNPAAARQLRPADSVTAGVRPEALIPAAPGPNTFPARIEVVEPLGDRMDVHLTAGETRLTCRTDSRSGLREGEIAHFTADPARIHLFNAAGLNLAL
jgi:multiple sugar transport system ATP-binding protein